MTHTQPTASEEDEQGVEPQEMGNPSKGVAIGGQWNYSLMRGVTRSESVEANDPCSRIVWEASHQRGESPARGPPPTMRRILRSETVE